jgi:CheY-like chemotaxis protein
MGHLLSFNDSTPPFQPQQHPEPALPPTQNINTCSKSALLVENDESLSKFLRRCLKDEGYAVRTASNTGEGLRLYRDCAPFNVVLIDYCAPQRNEVVINCLAPQTKGIELALAIQGVDPSQGIIIAAFAYRSAAEVPRPPQAMHIPILTDWSVSQLRSLLEKIEVRRAIKTLTASPSSPELLRLQRFAKFKVRGLGRAACGRDWDDLLEEALYRTLIGAENTQNGRHWNRTVTFVQHLVGAISSIASVWRRQFKENNTYPISELVVHDAEGQEHSPLDKVPSGCAPADECLIERGEKERFLTMLGDNADASQVFRGLVDGLQKNEIKSKYGLDERKYTAAIRRIRVRLLRSNRSRGGGNGK